MTAHLPTAGTFTLVDDTSTAGVIARLARGHAAAAASAVAQLLALDNVRDALASSGAAVAGAALVTAQRQRAALERLRVAALEPTTTEHALQKALSGEWWLFGGRFLGEHPRRQFTSLDQIDIPLLRSDGSLHIVELKRANIPRLIVPHRKHFVVGEDVHLAVGQVMNYLQALDEQASQIRQDFSIDVRRASATVVIGHQDLSSRSQEEVAQTLRTYNSHLARVAVITYSELIAGAVAALSAAEEEVTGALADSEAVVVDENRQVSTNIGGSTWRARDFDTDPWTTPAADWSDDSPW